MSELTARLADYVALRRSLGFVLNDGNYLLPSLVGYLDAHGADYVTTELALGWAISPPGVLAVTRRQRLGAARAFAGYLAAVDGRSEIPPVDLLPARYVRVTPYVYSDSDLSRLLAAARTLTSPWRACTYETLISLLAVTGARVGEAARLSVDDVDYDRCVLVVRNSKHEHGREIPLHASTLAALAAYTTARARQFPDVTTDVLLLSSAATPLYLRTVQQVHAGLVAAAGLEPRGERCRPRLHDHRHTFAVKTLIGWYAEGADVDARMPLLSKAMGHANPAHTYWYLEAVPELVAIVAERARPAFEGVL